MGPSLGRRALDEGQPVRSENRDGGAAAGDRAGVGGTAVEEVAAAFAAADRGKERALDPVLVANGSFRPRQRAPEGDQVAAVRGPEGAAGEGEVESLDEVGLAGPVRADD